MLHVNYRGSIGFGRAPLNTLPGKCGSQDVADVVTATKAALAMCDESIDPERVAVVGGSHGGFLGAHLIGQVRSVEFKLSCRRGLRITSLAPA